MLLLLLSLSSYLTNLNLDWAKVVIVGQVVIKHVMSSKRKDEKEINTSAASVECELIDYEPHNSLNMKWLVTICLIAQRSRKATEKNEKKTEFAHVLYKQLRSCRANDIQTQNSDQKWSTCEYKELILSFDQMLIFYHAFLVRLMSRVFQVS